MFNKTIATVAFIVTATAAVADHGPKKVGFSDNCLVIGQLVEGSRDRSPWFTKVTQSVVGVHADGIWGRGTQGAAENYLLTVCHDDSWAGDHEPVRNFEQERIEAEKIRLQKEREELARERKRIEDERNEAKRQAAMNKRGLLTTEEYRLVYGSTNDSVRAYEQAVRKVREMGYRNPKLVNSYGHAKLHKMFFRHTFKFKGRRGEITIRVSEHLFGSAKDAHVISETRYENKDRRDDRRNNRNNKG